MKKIKFKGIIKYIIIPFLAFYLVVFGVVSSSFLVGFVLGGSCVYVFLKYFVNDRKIQGLLKRLK